LEDWLRVATRTPAAPRINAPLDFTALVMSRIQKQPVEPAPSVIAPVHERVHAVGGTLAFSALLLAASALALLRFEPGAAFAVLGILVTALVLMATMVRAISDSLYAVSSNTGLMLLVTAVLGGLLLLWAQVARASERVAREA
jgi:hypothetical protein